MKIDQSWYQKPEGIEEDETAGGIVVRTEDNNIYVALIKEEGGFISYDLPKGHLEEGEDYLTAAKREIEEEAGFTDLKLINDLGKKGRLSFHKTHWVNTHYFLFVTNQKNAIPTDPKHTNQPPVWYLLDDLPDIFWPDQRALVEDNRENIKKLVLEENSNLQKIASKSGVNFYTDNSETLEELIQSLNSLKNIILIFGGEFEGDFSELGHIVDRKVKALYFLNSPAADSLREKVMHKNILRSTYSDLETLLNDLKFEIKNRDNILYSNSEDSAEEFKILVEKIFK